MRLIVLGSGTCVPLYDRGNAGYYLESDNDHILIDPGSGAIRFLARSGIDYKKINSICFSHLHPDHTTDIIALLFGLIHDENRSNPINIRIVAPEGFKKFINSLKSIYHDWIDSPEVKLSISEVSSGTVYLNNMNIEIFRTEHTRQSIAFIFRDKVKSFLYTGDTDFSNILKEKIAQVEHLLIECSHMKTKTSGHISPEKLKRLIASKNRLKTIVLTHFYEEIRFQQLAEKLLKLNIINPRKLHFALEMEEYIFK